MKRVLSVLLAVLLLCGVGAVASHAAVDITEKFTDLNFRAAVYDHIPNKAAPDPINATDVAEIPTLFVGNRNIQNLEGIGYFTALETLLCPSNLLAEINVSNNAALKWFHCYRNQLTELDVS